MRIRVIKGFFIEFGLGVGITVDEFGDKVVLAVCFDFYGKTTVVEAKLFLSLLLLFFQLFSLLLEQHLLYLLIVPLLVLSLLLYSP